MNTEFGDKLIAAFDRSKNDINNFVWKGPKERDAQGNFTQDEFRLVDATEAQLRKAYKHCHTMLYNTDKKFVGRVNLLKEISDQRDRCGVELFYRDAESRKTTRFAIVDALRSAISKASLTSIELDDLRIGTLMTTNSDFQNLPVNLVIDGGLDKLGRFDRSHITLTFILKQGLWFEKQELKEFNELFSKSDKKGDRTSIVKSKLGLPADAKLYFNALGLNYSELKSMLALKSMKYSTLTTEQLRTLRSKLLFALEDEVSFHIGQWNLRKTQIEQVSANQDFLLN